MSTDVDLFTPITIGAYELPNRIVMAPMTRNRAGDGNVVHELQQEYYRQRASAGLIITEATQVSPQGVGYPATPGIHSAEQTRSWKMVTDAVHEDGGRIFLQLWHVGRISHPSMQVDGQLPVAPSAIRPEGEAFTYQGLQAFVTPRGLDKDELPGLVQDYVRAAHNALEAGFDGVEVHAANGYLLDEFIRDGSNHREDEYGGSIENRSRLLSEVVSAVCDAIGNDKVGVRLSPENSFNSMQDSDAQNTFNYVVAMLSGFKLAYLHLLEGDMMTQQRSLDYQQFKQRFDGPYMANCGYDYEKAQAVIQNGAADFVSFGSLFIGNPDLPARFKAGVELAVADQATFYGGDEKGYTDYPTMSA